MGCLLQPGGDVDGIACGQALLGTGHHLAGVDADTRLHAELREGVSHLHGCSTGPERVVLVYLRNAEHSHHRIADELLDHPTVRLDDALHALEVAGEQSAQRLRIGRLAKRGRTGHIAEEDGDRLALLSRGRRGRQRRRAEAAELEAVRVLLPAGRAGRHRPSLRQPRLSVEQEEGVGLLSSWTRNRVPKYVPNCRNPTELREPHSTSQHRIELRAGVFTELRIRVRRFDSSRGHSGNRWIQATFPFSKALS